VAEIKAILSGRYVLYTKESERLVSNALTLDEMLEAIAEEEDTTVEIVKLALEDDAADFEFIKSFMNM
jgi:precorrin-6B methylase 2